MRRWLGIGGVLAVVWLFVRGVTPETVVGEFLIGLAVGVPIAYAFRRFYEPGLAVGTTLSGLPWVGVYVAVFLWELLTANVDVAYRVLAPSMPIEPDVVELPLRVQSDAAITTIANSITLTPGTLTMDYDEQRNSLYVHAIDGRDHASIVDPIRTWEDYALRIFDEELEPGAPIPDPDRVASDDGESALDPTATAGGEADGE
ncbi:Na+/H+ antiporter subunit E [Haloarcula onubensis]|uniref:Na+/H+ antiporter subunit E n=1 Tax=Haloarcula onubensis TaxID=2950539 RepID=A0ABU2FMS0_9EURY|nr:Na+/H+ antiporter subunit E [Halomicroarcula sp. S3CR25-11]MDS0281542.1 Na+/H+ antiporter subunit E [Halomicroarcula sp. S3CR25-11]